MFQKTRVAKALLLAFGGVMVAGAATAQTAEPQRIEITGSAIKRTSVEGVAPVDIVTREDIARTGATSINELIRSIPSIDVFDQGELAGNSPSGSGTANLQMRGLSSNNLLVLLNGRRVPVNALYDASGAGAAFDINMIPVSAIDRIDILKDGGSAIYGADAVAGVINIITRTDYQGIEANAGYGVSKEGDGKETRVGFSAGFGSLTEDRFNVLIGVDYFKRDPILRKDRDLTRSVDFRRFGGPDRRSSFAPQGNIVDPLTGGFVGLPYTDCPPELESGGLCRYDFNASLLNSYNGADRLGALAVANWQITPDLRVFGELTYSLSKDTFKAHPVPDFFIVPITDESQRPFEIPEEFGLGTDKLYIAGRFMQGGPRTTNREATLLSTVVGVEGLFAGIDWKASLGRGESKVTNSDSNYYDATLWFPATGAGLIDPTSNNNDPAFVESLKVNPVREGKSVLTQANLLGRGEMMQLPAGPLGYAVGMSYVEESLSDQPDPLTQQGLVVGSIAQSAVDADRKNAAVFAELAIPVTKTLEAQAAIRWDKYPGSSATSPKFGLKWAATPDLSFRGSFSKSFRAPVLKQLFGGQEQGATTVTDPELCQILFNLPTVPEPEDCLVNAFQVNGSNPTLKPEKGTTYNLGVVFDVSKTASASIDLWRIEKTNDISAPTIESAIRSGLFQRNGPRIDIFTNLQNIADRVTQGVDIDARLRFPGLSVGNVTIRNLVTFYDSIKSRTSSSGQFAEFVGTYAQPRFRNTLLATLETGPWTFNGSLRTTGGFIDEDDTTALAGARKVGKHEEVDVQASYAGFKGLEVAVGVKNLFDRMPPLSIQNASSNSYTQMGFAELYSARGRFFYVNANYAFR